ncbi:hypothetical protein I0P70_12410 [Pontibacter sp. FD36]|uniref:CHAT domain-containing protein n=1 Tax=Pontibacter sp. FD36 TaxID=2789860 RepID=UPI0018A9E88A|nr:CHAT domain-containing protein [Pontibacter sp. FD36]MBF8964050.1 hypothetical protein [Pontibacter sp. FD36]
MILKDTFPNFYNESSKEGLNLWQTEFADVDFATIDIMVATELQQIAQVEIEDFNRVSKIFLEDCIAAKRHYSDVEKEKLNYLQFINAATAAGLNCHQSLFQNAHDWLIWTLSDEINYGNEVKFDDKRLTDFLNSKNEFISQNALGVIFYWLGNLFYYSWHRGGLKEFADEYYNRFIILVKSYFRKGIPPELGQDQFINTVCHMLAWAINNKKDTAADLATSVEFIFPQVSELNQKKIAMQLATGGAKFTTKKSDVWAKIGLDHFATLLGKHDKLHLHSIYYTNHLDELETDFSEMLGAISTYKDSISHISPIEAKYERAKIFGVIRGLIKKCLEEGKAKLASEVLCSYAGVDEELQALEHQLFIVVNYDRGVLLTSDTSLEKLENNFSQTFVDLIVESNRFLSAKVILDDLPGFNLEEPENLGVPVKSRGREFESKLINHYQFDKLTSDSLNAVESMIVLPGLQHPIQALMMKYMGTTLPINASLEKSLPSRKCNKVLLWCFGTRSSDIEAKLVRGILSASGIEVEVADILSETKESFLMKYYSSEYDLIWLATHGEYNHELPHKSTIEILPEYTIELSELQNTISGSDKQRMIFLNICDGATASTLNALYDIGFGASICGASQAVLSHIWPIEIESALIYGLVYAHFISGGKNYWEAYELTVKTILKGNGDVFRIIDEIVEKYDSEGEAVRLLVNLDKNIRDNIYYWGSGVFYN